MQYCNGHGAQRFPLTRWRSYQMRTQFASRELLDRINIVVITLYFIAVVLGMIVVQDLLLHNNTNLASRIQPGKSGPGETLTIRLGTIILILLHPFAMNKPQSITMPQQLYPSAISKPRSITERNISVKEIYQHTRSLLSRLQRPAQQYLQPSSQTYVSAMPQMAGPSQQTQHLMYNSDYFQHYQVQAASAGYPPPPFTQYREKYATHAPLSHPFCGITSDPLISEQPRYPASPFASDLPSRPSRPGFPGQSRTVLQVSWDMSIPQPSSYGGCAFHTGQNLGDEITQGRQRTETDSVFCVCFQGTPREEEINLPSPPTDNYVTSNDLDKELAKVALYLFEE